MSNKRDSLPVESFEWESPSKLDEEPWTCLFVPNDAKQCRNTALIKVHSSSSRVAEATLSQGTALGPDNATEVMRSLGSSVLEANDVKTRQTTATLRVDGKPPLTPIASLTAPPNFDTTGQVRPLGGTPRVTTILWEDEGTRCFQVEAEGVNVLRREDNHMINGTNLLKVAAVFKRRRDEILKNEKTKHVVRLTRMEHLKGVWIPFERALDLANREHITESLYPLFVHKIGALLYHPVNSGARRGNRSLKRSLSPTLPTNASSVIDCPTSNSQKAHLSVPVIPLDQSSYATITNSPPTNTTHPPDYRSASIVDGHSANLSEDFSCLTLSQLALKDLKVVRVTYIVHWDILSFVQSQFSEGPSCLKDVLVVTDSSPISAQATTAGEYLRQSWPSTGPSLLATLQAAINDKDLWAEATISGVEIEILLTKPATIRAVGPPEAFADLLVQIGWIGAALRLPQSGRFEKCEATFGAPRRLNDGILRSVTFTPVPISEEQQWLWQRLFEKRRRFPEAFPVPTNDK